MVKNGEESLRLNYHGKRMGRLLTANRSGTERAGEMEESVLVSHDGHTGTRPKAGAAASLIVSLAHSSPLLVKEKHCEAGDQQGSYVFAFAKEVRSQIIKMCGKIAHY